MINANELECKEIIEKEDLLVFLKKGSADIDLNDIMQASLFLINDAKYVQTGYRDRYIKAYTKAFLIRITDLKDDKSEYNGQIDKDELLDALNLLDEQESQVANLDLFDPSFFRIYKIISIYTTFVLEEPVHPVGTPFPGGFEVKYENGEYLCPVKEKQKDNPGAVCGFCIAEQDESV